MKPSELGATVSSLLGVDTGGTFTDFVFYHNGQLHVHKVLSTPDAPERAILQGIADLGLSLQGLQIVHGSTVATNAVLERRGVRTAYISNRGFGDVLTIGRQARKSLYELQPNITPPPVPAELCLETGGRLSAEGDVLEPLSDQDIEVLCQQIQALQPQAVAINLLFSYLDPALEQRIAAALPEDLFVACSSAVLPEYREYERGIATWLNAFVGPLLQGYLNRLEQAVMPATVAVMQSSAGTVRASKAGRLAVNMLLSGPAGGLMAARHIGRQISQQRLLTFDMGGTSTDVALIDGDVRLTSEGTIGDYPVAVPMVDMHTIGAGGGSIAYVDAGGMLHVGPQSAGASPGPACYGQGGEKPTVTDANLILGRIQADAFLGGRMQLDIEAARRAMSGIASIMQLTIEQAAEGVVELANEHMVRALRVISLHRGCDPRDYVLVSFGGAGGLHVCALADAMQMKRAVVPVQGGVLSALGMLVTPVSRQFSLTMTAALDEINRDELRRHYKRLIDHGVKEMDQEGLEMADMTVRCSMDLRYIGQSYYLNVDIDLDEADLQLCEQDFNAQHLRVYGHSLAGPVELVNIRVAVSGPVPDLVLQPYEQTATAAPFRQVQLPGTGSPAQVYRRAELGFRQLLTGPALVLEEVATTFIAPGWDCYRDEIGNLMLTRD
jgi:N-methylhydantoinase A